MACRASNLRVPPDAGYRRRRQRGKINRTRATWSASGGQDMKAIKATYKNGRVTLSEKPPEPGPFEVLVVFPEPADDPWEAILHDPTPRPALVKRMTEVEREIAQG